METHDRRTTAPRRRRRRGLRPAGFAAVAATALLAAVFAAAPQAVTAAEAGEPEPYGWHRVAPGVWAALQPPAFHFRESNSLVVAGPAASLVVDAQGDPAKVAWLVERAGAEIAAAGGAPVRFLALTHWHGDHTQGAGAWQQVFPAVTVVGHRSLWDDVRGRTEPALEDDRKGLEAAIAEAEADLESGTDEKGEALTEDSERELRGAIAEARRRAGRMAAIRVPLPEVAVTDRLELNLGAREGSPQVILLHLPGHTAGDLVAWLPAERILASGDLLDALPFGGHGDLARWVESLEALAELPFETVVPGHGPVLRGEAAREHLRRVTGWLRFIATRAEGANARGEAPQDALAELRETAQWRSWRRELTGWPGDADSVARFGRVFDTFAPETFIRAMEVAADRRSGDGDADGDGGEPAS